MPIGARRSPARAAVRAARQQGGNSGSALRTRRLACSGAKRQDHENFRPGMGNNVLRAHAGLYRPATRRDRRQVRAAIMTDHRKRPRDPNQLDEKGSCKRLFFYSGGFADGAERIFSSRRTQQ